MRTTAATSCDLNKILLALWKRDGSARYVPPCLPVSVEIWSAHWTLHILRHVSGPLIINISYLLQFGVFHHRNVMSLKAVCNCFTTVLALVKCGKMTVIQPWVSYCLILLLFSSLCMIAVFLRLFPAATKLWNKQTSSWTRALDCRLQSSAWTCILTQ